MKRLAGFVVLGVLVAASVNHVQRLDRDRQYRRLLIAGEVALGQGQSHLAIEHFSGAIALRPRAMVAYYWRGEAYRHQRQDDRAIRDLREAARLSPSAPQPLAGLGKLFDERGEHAQAAEWYRQAADRLTDTDTDVLYSLALALYRSGSPAAARDPLRRALAGADSAEGRYLLGLVYRDAQSGDEAMLALEQAVKLAPTLIPAREELADVYRQRGRGTDEIAQLRALVVLDDRVDRRVTLGLAEARANRFEDAIGTLTAASAAAPKDSRLLLATGRVLLARAERTGDRRSIVRALTALERALGGTARRSEGLALYGRALHLSGDVNGAERILQEALATSPIDAEAFGFLADAAEQASHPLVARDALIDLEAIEGDTVSAGQRSLRARRIGALSLAANDPRTAVAFLNQSTNTTGPDSRTLGLLARARWQTGDADGAREALSQALALNAADDALLRLKRTIR
jgi:tetratricopeptide (TPR) repeat protein